MQVAFDNQYVGAEYAFDTTRKARHIADALETGRVAGVELVAPGATHLATAELHIERVHSARRA